MGGEQGRSPDHLYGLSEIEIVFLDIFTEPFKAGESGMALVAVIYLRVDAKDPQSPDSTDAQQQLLLETVLPIATVKMIGHLTVLGDVGLIIGVEKVQVGTSNGDLPDPGGDVPSGEGHASGHPVAGLVQDRLGGNLGEILRIVLGHLLTLSGEYLGEIAVPV